MASIPRYEEGRKCLLTKHAAADLFDNSPTGVYPSKHETLAQYYQCWANVVCRQWTNVDPAQGQLIVFAEIAVILEWTCDNVHILIIRTNTTSSNRIRYFDAVSVRPM